MTFGEQLAITILDKAVIGGIIVIAGYFLNQRLRAFESRQARIRDDELTRNKAALAQLEAQIGGGLHSN